MRLGSATCGGSSNIALCSNLIAANRLLNAGDGPVSQHQALNDTNHGRFMVSPIKMSLLRVDNTMLPRGLMAK